MIFISVLYTIKSIKTSIKRNIVESDFRLEIITITNSQTADAGERDK